MWVAGFEADTFGISCRIFTTPYKYIINLEIEDLPGAIQEQLFSELLDREVQATLEAEPAFINWSLEITMRLGNDNSTVWL